MELKVICKRLITQNLDGNITEGEYGADIVGITVPRMYGEHDLSAFSFRMTAVSKANESIAEQVLTMDNADENNIHLLWEVTSDFTVSSGEVTLVLAGVNADNTVQIKFASQPVVINDDARLDFMESPTVLEQAYNQVQLEVQKVLDILEDIEGGTVTLYPATETELGGVLSGGDISVDENGAVTVNSVNGKTVGTDVPENAVFTDTVYTLPTASRTVKGGVKVDGTTIVISNSGIISAVGGTSGSGDGESSGTVIPFILEPATEEYLGGILSGGDVSVDENGAVTVNSVNGKTVGTDVPENAVFTDTVYTLPTASETELGGVLSGGDISVDGNGAVTVNSVSGKTIGTDVPDDAVFTDTVYTLPAASETELGGVKVDGTTVTIDENGVISAEGDYVPVSGGTMGGTLIAQSNTDYTVAQVRNIIISSEAPSVTAPEGTIWYQYEVTE